METDIDAQILNRALLKILAVARDPDVQTALRRCYLAELDRKLPEIQVGE